MKEYEVLERLKNEETGERYTRGSIVRLSSESEQVKTWLHFGRIREVAAPKPAEAKPAAPKSADKPAEKGDK